jgi:hypothetical protein
MLKKSHADSRRLKSADLRGLFQMGNRQYTQVLVFLNCLDNNNNNNNNNKSARISGKLDLRKSARKNNLTDSL